MAAAIHRLACRSSTSPRKRGSRCWSPCGTCLAIRPMRQTTASLAGLKSIRFRRIPDADDDAIHEWVTDWLQERRSLLAAVRSQVLPEADVVLMNPLHPDAARVPPLGTRPFSFAECLHTPPMSARYKSEG